MNSSKECTKCKSIKLLELFPKNKTKKGGYDNRCKECASKYKKENHSWISVKAKQYRINNIDKLKALQKINREKNKDKYKEDIKQWRFKNADRIKAYTKQYGELNKDKIKEKSRKYYKENKERCSEYSKKYRKENPHIVNALNIKRYAQKIKACPKWLTKAQLAEIVDFYKQAKELEAIFFNRKFHVDHIIPLQGKEVCGLHVPWNLQILTAEENFKKNNKY